MSDYIPSELYHEILVRLPAESLLRFRSVCKAWLRLIDDRAFVKSHQLFSSNHNNTLLIRNRNPTGAPLYLINLDTIDFTKTDRQLIDTIPVKQLYRPDVPFEKFNRKTCNGLILISHNKIRNIWAIWNPLTRSCHQLPPPPDEADIKTYDRSITEYPATGLGYYYDADDYKVVRIDNLISKTEGVDVCRTLVYSLNLGCWRRIKDCPYNILYDLLSYDSHDSSKWIDRNGVFLNGAIHWLLKDMVCVLDLGTEDYRQLALPPLLATFDRMSYDFYVILDAIGGCLSLTLSDPTVNFSGWVMKDYGADWVKLFTLDLGRGISGGIPVRLVVFLEGRKQVLFRQGYDRGFLWYDVENGDVKQVSFHGLSITSSQICPGSIYRLDDNDSRFFSGNDCSEKRFKLCLRDCDTMYCSDSSCHSPVDA